MRYSTGPKDRKYVKGKGILSFAKTTGTNLSRKYCKIFLIVQKNQLQMH